MDQRTKFLYNARLGSITEGSFYDNVKDTLLRRKINYMQFNKDKIKVSVETPVKTKLFGTNLIISGHSFEEIGNQPAYGFTLAEMFANFKASDFSHNVYCYIDWNNDISIRTNEEKKISKIADYFNLKFIENISMKNSRNYYKHYQAI